MRTLVALLVAAALLPSPAIAEPAPAPGSQPRIINGEVAPAGAWPAMAALFVGGGFFCGGTLIAPEWVLTAAHCMVDARDGGLAYGPGDLTLVVGDDDWSDPGGDRIVAAELLPHPDYQPFGFSNDVGLVRLRGPSSMTPQRLAGQGDTGLAAPGTTAIVTGYGATNPDRTGASPRLRQAEVPIWADQDCARVYGGLNGPLMVCAGIPGTAQQPGVDSCAGDSGGPLTVPDGGDRVQVGVVSFGPALCATGAPGVYTEVAAVRGWVDDVTGGLPGPDADDDPDPGGDPADPGPADPSAEPDPGDDPADPDPGVDPTGDPAGVIRVAPLTTPTTAVGQALATSAVSFADRSARWAVVARGDVFADALGGSALAYGVAPLLYADPDGTISQAVLDELWRVLGPGGRVYLLGGIAALPAAAEATLARAGFDTVRLAGATREETAAVVARRVAQVLGDGPDQPPFNAVIVATSALWPDAVVAGQLASWFGVPVLLTPPDRLHPATAEALSAIGPSQVLLIGGERAISAAVAAEVAARSQPGAVERLGGATRVETAHAVLRRTVQAHQRVRGQSPACAVAVDVRGDGGFAHALSASMITGRFTGVMVPVDGGVSADTAATVCRAGFTPVVAGGPDVVSGAAAHALVDALSGRAC